MKLTFEFDLDLIGTDRKAFDRIQRHIDKMFEQIKRYPQQLGEPNLGYSCSEEQDKPGEIVSRWYIADEGW